jgi:hypothetical protein
VVCAPWRFRAERVALDWSDTLTALPAAPSLDTFVGTFATKTGFSEGTLRLVRLADGRLVANYGTPTVPRIIGFDGQRLDTEVGALELFAYDEHELRVKWHLRYGTEGGKLALSGYGLSTSGRFYSVNGKRL